MAMHLENELGKLKRLVFAVSARVEDSLQKSVLAVERRDTELASQVKGRILTNPEDLEALINLLLVSRHIERIADHATNIAEDAIYMVEGQIVHHWTDKDSR